MATLPAIKSRSCTPGETTITITASTPVYGVYPGWLPPAPDVPSRSINVLTAAQNPRGRGRTVMLETMAPHTSNDQRLMRLKQRDHYRYHNAWSKYYYGSKAEQEQYRAYNRDVLKQQMADLDKSQRQTFQDKSQESLLTMAIDSQNRKEDSVAFQTRFNQLKTFRDQNKNMMENAWDFRKRRKVSDDCYDREQLKYNPINWSGTLK